MIEAFPEFSENTLSFTFEATAWDVERAGDERIMQRKIYRIQQGGITPSFVFHHGATEDWPAFNIADSAITIGGVLLAWHFFRIANKQP